MTYATTNHRAINHPLRSIPLLRPLSVLGSSFQTQADPAAVALATAQRTLHLARGALASREAAYTDAKAAIGTVNRMGRKDRHDRAIVSDRTVARRRSEAFGTMNRRRGALVRARKAVVAAEAALLALAV